MALDAGPAFGDVAERRVAGAPACDERGVQGTGRGPHQQVGAHLPFGEGLQHPALGGAQTLAAGQDECGDRVVCRSARAGLAEAGEQSIRHGAGGEGVRQSGEGQREQA